MKRLVVTADDFGAAREVNEAVEIAHTRGILTATSLMVAAPAAAEAVALAKRLPSLRVGLHVVLVEGRPMLPLSQIPDLVDANGLFRSNMAASGASMFFLPKVRRQLEHEIEAQFEAFRATGLTLDHVNAHKHFHLHPTVLSLILSIGRDYGLRAVRWPAEPGSGPWLKPWLALMRLRLRRAGLRSNDHVFGIRDSGAMDEQALLDLLQRLPAGLSELYLHPATHGELTPSMAHYRHADELAALLSPRVRRAVAEHCQLCNGFSDPAAA